MDGYLRQSTASQTRTIGPFLDDTDFKTAEDALTIANTDVKLKKNGGASASKNSGGATADATNGLYHLTWDATDTATVGQLFYSVKVAGALAVFGTYTVIEEAEYDAHYVASAPGYVLSQPVDLNTIKTQTVTCAGGVTVPAATLASTTNITAGTMTTTTTATNLTTNNDKTGYALSTAGTLAIWDKLTSALTTVNTIGKLLVDNLTGPTGDIAGDVWDELSADHVAPGSMGDTLANAGAAGNPLEEPVPGSFADGTAGFALGYLDGFISDVQSMVTAIKAKTDNDPEGIKKNTALNNFEFFMALASDHVTGAPGLSVTATRSLDGGSFASCTNAVTEVSGGFYKINLSAADLNGGFVTLKFAAPSADTTGITIKTSL